MLIRAPTTIGTCHGSGHGRSCSPCVGQLRGTLVGGTAGAGAAASLRDDAFREYRLEAGDRKNSQ